MNQSIYKIKSNETIAPNVCRMVLAGDTSQITVPGQFVNIRLDGDFLRRPISVCERSDEDFVIIYKVVGRGTEQMAEMRAGQELDILTGLGNGYDLSLSGEKPLLIGGGAGVPPMYWLCKELIGMGRKVTVILGFNTASEVFCEKEFAELGADVKVMTADGSYGGKGFVTDAMTDLDYSYFYTCGPMPMFRAIQKIAVTSGQFSFEERMGCGFGACMGCSMMTAGGSKRVCKDGPVFQREEILW